MSMNARSLLRALTTLAGAAALTFAWAGPAVAHTELRASTPEEGSTVDHLSEVRLEFTGTLLAIGAELMLIDATGAEHALDPEFPSVNAVTGRVDRAMPAGDAQLHWRIVAEDGHPIDGVLAFTFEPSGEPAAGSPTPGETAASEPSAEPSAEPAPTETSATPEPSASADPEEDAADGLPGWALALLGLLAAGGAVAAILVRRARQ
ncbi:MAG: copper resistance protein CopC [Demequina sp.]